jgi:hypothetical protein
MNIAALAILVAAGPVLTTPVATATIPADLLKPEAIPAFCADQPNPKQCEDSASAARGQIMDAFKSPVTSDRLREEIRAILARNATARGIDWPASASTYAAFVRANPQFFEKTPGRGRTTRCTTTSTTSGIYATTTKSQTVCYSY